jgi:hypothetical protein
MSLRRYELLNEANESEQRPLLEDARRESLEPLCWRE